MKTMIGSSLLLAACATTGATLPAKSDATGMGRLVFDDNVISQDATPVVPGLASEATLPSAARLQTELRSFRDRFALSLQVCVGPDGNVQDVALDTSSGVEKLDLAAVSDVFEWRFDSFDAPANIRVCRNVNIRYRP